MNVAEYIHDMAVKARAAAGELAKLSTAEKNAALNAIADRLEQDAAAIKAANAIDAAIDALKLIPRFRPAAIG